MELEYSEDQVELVDFITDQQREIFWPGIEAWVESTFWEVANEF
jgi:hypothetical protein